MRDTFAFALLLGLLSCNGNDTIVDPNAEADSDTDTDADTDTDSDADADTDTDTDRTDNTLTFSAGNCSYDVTLQLTRITLDGGEYYNYEAAFLTENLGTDCEGDVLLPTPDKGDLVQFSDDYPDTYWAIYLPSLYADVGATLDVTIESSPNYESVKDTGGGTSDYSTVGELTGGNAYVALSDQLLVYVDGTIDQILEDLGMVQGWNVMEIDGTDLSTVKQAQAGATIALTTLNLEIDYDSITISGEPRRTDTTYTVGARPYSWMLQTDSKVDAYDGFLFDLEGNTAFDLTISGAPPSDHYIPAERVYDIDDFESCCQGDVPRAVEMPIIYFEDDDKTLTYSDTADGGICNDERHILLLHNPYPTHLWLAQWYLNNDEDPGWYIRYGNQEEWWKDLDRGSYGILNLSTTCSVFADWALTSL